MVGLPFTTYLLFMVMVFAVSGEIPADNGDLSSKMNTFSDITMLVWSFVFILFLGRFSFPFAAVAIGERLSFKESWALSKGHTGRIFLFLIPLLFQTDFNNMIKSLEGASFVLGASIGAGIWSAYYVFADTALAVWYERFRKREGTVRNQSEAVITAADYGQCQD